MSKQYERYIQLWFEFVTGKIPSFVVEFDSKRFIVNGEDLTAY